METFIIIFLVVVAIASVWKMIDLKRRNDGQAQHICEYAEELNRLRKEVSLYKQNDTKFVKNLSALKKEYEDKLTQTLREFRFYLRDNDVPYRVTKIEMVDNSLAGFPVFIEIKPTQVL